MSSLLTFPQLLAVYAGLYQNTRRTWLVFQIRQDENTNVRVLLFEGVFTEGTLLKGWQLHLTR